MDEDRFDDTVETLPATSPATSPAMPPGTPCIRERFMGYRVESSRLAGWDYATEGCYFVTICTHERQWFFGDVVDGEMLLTAAGMMAGFIWYQLPEHHPNMVCDEFVVMPNHVHGIVAILDPKGRGEGVTGGGAAEDMGDVAGAGNREVAGGGNRDDRDVAGDGDVAGYVSTGVGRMSAISPKVGSLSVIVRSYKAAVARWCGQNGYREFAWQSRFYDHIIRDAASLHNVRQYIRNNPANWRTDENNL